jgi:5-methylcytosine-specific restriction endonuclease McrA
MSSKNTQFKPTPNGEKTPRMLEVEARIGRTLEEDYREFFLKNRGRRGYGKKALANKWGVSRGLIWGPLGPGRRCWVEMLKLERDTTATEQQSRRASRKCEICPTDDVALERAHWIPRSEGGSTRADNILKLCPNCHTRLDGGDPAILKRAQRVLLVRAADAELKSTTVRDETMQRRFYDLCVSILEGRAIPSLEVEEG